MIQLYHGKTSGLKDLSHFFQKQKKRYLILLSVLMMLAISGYYNMGRFHGNNYAHYHEVVHYYLGSKYFSELGYHDLYNAFIAADRETGNKFKKINVIRDLRSKELADVSDISDQIKAVPPKFTSERWEEFKDEFKHFRSKRNFKDLMLDHGYNPSPVWTMEAKAVSSLLSPFSNSPKQMVKTIVLIDVVLLIFMFLMIWYAFGFVTMAFSVVFWGANPIVLFDYTGGAFMRQNWIVSLITGICLFKKNKEILAGAFIANSVGVRLFPGIFMVIPAFQFVYKWIKEKRFPVRLFRFGSSTVVFFIAFILLSLVFAGGTRSWKVFLKNATEHNKGIYTNHISYRNIFSYETNRNADSYRKTGKYHHEKWRLDKEERVARLKPVFYISLLVIMCFMFYLFKDDEPENGLYIGAFFPFLFFYPANYYAMYLLPLVFLAVKDRRMLLALFGSMIIGFSFYYIPQFDVVNIALSFFLLLLMVHLMIWQWSRINLI